MTISDDVRERLLALIDADEELRSWLADSLQLAAGDTDKALSQMLGKSHLLAETDPKCGRLIGFYKIALTEPEIKPTTTRAPIVTDSSAAWFVREIKPLLANEPEFARALSEQQRELEASGQPRGEATAIVVRNVLAMERDGVKPLDGDSPLARAVRLAGERVHNGSWKPQPEPHDPLAESAARNVGSFDAWLRHEQVNDPRHVTVIGGDGSFGIQDGREGRS